MLKSCSFSDRVIAAGGLAFTVVLPLWIAPLGRNAFKLPKAVFLWVVVAVLGAAWLIRSQPQAVHPGAARTSRRLLHRACLACRLSLLLSTCFSVNPLQSAQGSYDRMQGTLTLLCLLALFLMTTEWLREPDRADQLIAAIVWGSVAAGGVLLLAGVWAQGQHQLIVTAAVLSIIELFSGLLGLIVIPGLSGSIGARGAIWRAAWPLIIDRLIFDYGPEPFGQIFTSVFSPELVYMQGRAVNVDRAHNLILDMLVSMGVVGLLTYAAVIGLALAIGMRAWAQDCQVRWMLITGLVASVGHLVETQLSLSVTTTAVLFWLMLGMLAAPWESSRERSFPLPERRTAQGKPLRLLFAVLLLLTVIPANNKIR